MANYTFTANGKGRKALVTTIGEITGTTVKYLGPPTFAYEIGEFTVTKDGTLIGECDMDIQFRLAEYGFELEIANTAEEQTATEQDDTGQETPAELDEAALEPGDTGQEAPAEPEEAEIAPEPDDTGQEGPAEPEEAETAPEPDDTGQEAPAEPEEAETASDQAEPDRLTIEYPLTGITDEVLTNIRKMVAAKEPILKTALDAEELPIFLTSTSLKFPWFTGPFDEDTAHDYAQFIACLCETAKKKKRVTAQPINTDNARFSMRVWLISLGMIGPEYDGIRKRMIRPLSGDSGWRYGKPEKAEKAEEPGINALAETLADAELIHAVNQPLENGGADND